MTEASTDNKQKISQRMCVIITLLVFSYPFYASNILPMRLTLALFFLGAALIVVRYVRIGWFHPRDLRSLALWVFAALLVLVSFVFSGYKYEFSRVFYPACLSLAILCALIVSGFKGWAYTALKTACIMLLPFAIGTLFFYIFPGAFSPIKSILFPDSLFATGYKSGLTTHYSHNGTYNIMGFLMAFGLAFYSEGNKKARIVWGAVAALFLIALLLIGKRQTLLFGALAVVIVFLLSNQKGKIRILLLAAGVLALCGLIAMQFVPGIERTLLRFFSSFGSEDIGEVTSSRDVIWGAAASGWLERPLFGYGWGAFSYQFTETNTVHVAHNEVLDLLYNSGIVGAVVFIFCIFATLIVTIYMFYSTEHSKIKSSFRHLRTILAISLMIQLYDVLMSFTIGSLLGAPSSFMPYLLSVGIALCCYREIGPLSKLRQVSKRSKLGLHGRLD